MRNAGHPKRPKQHVDESRSLAIFAYNAPAAWIIRQVSERDYGIDLYVELTQADGQMSGELAALQLKGAEDIEFDDGLYFLRQIKRTTLSYWLSLAVPVFLIAVSRKSGAMYWANVRQQDREGQFARSSKYVSVRLDSISNFSEAGITAFLESYGTERRWREIEAAIEKALMLFNTFGPLVLMFKRLHKHIPCTTTMQYLLVQHYDYFIILSEYLLKEKPKALDYWYEQNEIYHQTEGLEPSLTFYGLIARRLLEESVSKYRDCLIAAYELVTERQAHYFRRRYPHLSAHLKDRPLTFLADDWFPRFFFDEYENETRNLPLLYFLDFDEFDNVLPDLTRT